jgi:hypothetical protein
MLEISHCHCNLATTTAACWPASLKRPLEPITPELQMQFGLTEYDAEQAFKEARLIHARLC